MRELSPLRWRDKRLYIIDQRLLPAKEKWVELKDERDVFFAIRDMQIRGAPAIGIVAAFGFLLGLRRLKFRSRKYVVKKLRHIHRFLGSARPTAINLMWALNRMLKRAESLLVEDRYQFEDIIKIVESEAINILNEDVKVNRMIGKNGNQLIPTSASILTHCNAGALAVGGYGTAIGVIRSAFEEGKNITVFVDETRPYLQGARLTSYELKKLGIRHFVITDNAAGFLMRLGKIDLVITGADRIVRNGDTANKIGTYSLAVLAKENKIPFYVAAPLSTFDMDLKDGSRIPVEERSSEEVVVIAGKRIAPKGIKAIHLGFDVTPAKYIDAIITERGIIYPPYKKNIIKFINSSK
ncbi:MAG: S-methyl-5-thioribose-1-phosphate isomerase [Deltaproteobacteria bacterium]|nr:S-methyl-5-thioribose-1-phosphate isomerase [Deltaproteobacteria bacterium]